MIRKLIGEEIPRRPLSDQALAHELNRRGISVARRTVAKYREGMNIPSSADRCRLG
jgi:RNA polymerase sigma-54 factor